MTKPSIDSRVSQRTFLGVSALVFGVGVVLTIAGSVSMSTMGEMPMPGGGSMSMMWMRMCGQSWPGVAASFLGMWLAMMVAMMLPALVPMLWRYREAVGGAGEIRLGWLTVWVGTGYFVVWTALGMIVFPLGVAFAALEMALPALTRAVPLAAGVIVLSAGMLQFTAWKARRLADCHGAPARCVMVPVPRAVPPPSANANANANAATAWRHGLHLGLQCCYCCAGLTIVLLVLGMMDWRVMAAVTGPSPPSGWRRMVNVLLALSAWPWWAQAWC